VSLLTLFYFVSSDIRDILFNSRDAISSSRNTFHTPLQIISMLGTTSSSSSRSSSSFVYLPPGKYKVTAVAAKPKLKPNGSMEEIKELYARGEIGRRLHNGKFFCQCSYCCSQCKGTTFVKLTRLHNE
jgi:hypothetical protein